MIEATKHFVFINDLALYSHLLIPMFRDEKIVKYSIKLFFLNFLRRCENIVLDFFIVALILKVPGD